MYFHTLAASAEGEAMEAVGGLVDQVAEGLAAVEVAEAVEAAPGAVALEDNSTIIYGRLF